MNVPILKQRADLLAAAVLRGTGWVIHQGMASRYLVPGLQVGLRTTTHFINESRWRDLITELGDGLPSLPSGYLVASGTVAHVTQEPGVLPEGVNIKHPRQWAVLLHEIRPLAKPRPLASSWGRAHVDCEELRDSLPSSDDTSVKPPSSAPRLIRAALLRSLLLQSDFVLQALTHPQDRMMARLAGASMVKELGLDPSLDLAVALMAGANASLDLES